MSDNAKEGLEHGSCPLRTKGDNNPGDLSSRKWRIDLAIQKGTACRSFVRRQNPRHGRAPPKMWD